MNKLKALRKEIEQKNLDGYIVPLADRFGSEFIAPSERHLEWLTAFSGSAGIAIILKKKAAFFTDGRYLLQAEGQIKNTYTIYNMAKKTTFEWLEENMQKGDCLGYNSWLHTENEKLQFENAGQNAGFKLVSTTNLIDNIWKKVEEKIVGEIFIHKIKYAGKTSKEKIADLCAKLKKEDGDAFFLTSPESISWLLNIRGDNLPYTPVVLCYAVVHKTGAIILYLNGQKISNDVRKHLSKKIEIVQVANLKINNLSGKTILLDPALTPAALFNIMEANEAIIKKIKDPCILPKACKNPTEIKGAKKAHIDDGVALCRFFSWLKNELSKGKIVTELSAATKLSAFRTEGKNYISQSFNTISAYGSNGAIIHYNATKQTNKVLKNGSLYLLDSGGQYSSGTTDVTRTIAIGHPTAIQKHHYTLVLKGHIALAKVKFPHGTRGSALDILARYPLWQENLDYAHGTGHGVGNFLNVHEGPHSISCKQDDTCLLPGMIISNEPGYYKEGEYGIRIENLLAIQKIGTSSTEELFYEFETITLVPLDMSLIENCLLTKDEISWINNYHIRIRKILLPLLDKGTADWLKVNTKPLSC